MPTDGIAVLTPGHFLIGDSLRSLPEKVDVVPNISPLRRWNLRQLLSAQLWECWSKEYICTLNRFNKRKHPQKNLAKGDIVLIKDQELFKRSWPLARIEEVHPGGDNRVRVATARTNRGTYVRPITMLVPLLTDGGASSTLSPRIATQAPGVCSFKL